MINQLNYIVAQQHIADLHRTAERRRLANAAGIRSAGERRSSPITRVRQRLALLSARSTPARL
jgi:hypothetical protein